MGVDEAGCDDVAGGVDSAPWSPCFENASCVANGDDEASVDSKSGVGVDAGLGSQVEHSADDDKQVARLRIARGAG